MAAKHQIKFGPNAKSSDVSKYSKSVLQAIMEESEVFEVLVTSTARDAFNQARVMYDNIVAEGVAAQKALYGSAGDAIIDVYSAAKRARKSKADIIELMKAKILEIGPARVSHHAVDLDKMNVFDVAPSSIPAGKKRKWEAAIKNSPSLKRYIFPPKDRGYHFEIEQPPTS